MNMSADKNPTKALPQVISAEDAHAMRQKGEVTIIDVRTPMEWTRSGVAEGALAISPQDPSFIQQLEDAVDGDKGKPIALICATGNRTAMIQRYLQDHGWSNVADISEGMMGNWTAVGWLRKNLPTVRWKA